MTCEYVDKASGKNGDRPQFQTMLADAARHRFDVLLFWSLDRLTREGTFKTLCYLRQLADAGVKYRSYTEQYLDTVGAWGEAIAAVLATVAKQERQRIIERTKAGLERARRSGKRLGRPERFPLLEAQARKLRAKRMSYRQIARKLKCDHGWLWRNLTATKRKSAARATSRVRAGAR